jgi:phage-related minor tail protein
MAGESVVRRDVVQIGFDIDFSELRKVQESVDDVVQAVKPMQETIKDSTAAVTETTQEVKKLTDEVQNVTDTGVKPLNDGLEETRETAQECEVLFSAMVKQLANSVSGKLKQLPTILHSSAKAAKDFASMLRSKITGSIKKVISSVNKVKNGFQSLKKLKLQTVTDKLKKGLDKSLQSVKKLKTNILTGIDKGLGKAVINARKLPTALKAATFKTVVNSVKRLKTGFTQATKSVKTMLTNLMKSKTQLNAMNGIAGKLGGVLAAAGAAFSVGNAFQSITSAQQALNTFQASTGVASGEMAEYGDAIKELYGNAMGESIGDVANAMALVKQTTGMTGDELKNTTSNALLMRDTFQFDVQESIRAADMLMSQFGVSSDEAYSMIAQGAQNGLNKNGDLLDTINEYSVHFKQLGFDSDEMFNMLVNGAKSGTFSVDKLGDAVKEFGVRVIDGSDTTSEGFKAIGLDASAMAQKFKAGGETGKQAFAETVEALKNMKDPVQQNIAGVNLFGTMWEDLGAEGVFALSEITGEVTGTTDALNQINEVRYDDAATALEAIKRKAGLELNKALTPVLNKVIQLINKFSDWASKTNLLEKAKTTFDNIKTAVEPVTTAVGNLVKSIFEFATKESTISGIKTVFEGIGKVMKPIGAVIQFIADNMDVLAPIILAVVGALTAFSVVMGIVNAVMAISPITWIILAIVALIAIIALCVKHWDTIKAAMQSVWEKIKEVFGMLAEWFMTNVVNPVVTFFTGLWTSITTIFTNIKNAIVTAFTLVVLMFQAKIATIQNFFVGLWNGIVAIFSGVAEWFSGVFTSAVELIKSAFSTVVSFFQGIWDSIKSMFEKIGTTIGNGIADAFAFVVNSVIGFAENTINGFIRAINGAIDLINAIPGVSISHVSELSIPRLAKGGIVDKPTIAQIGEDGKEAVVPLENNLGWIRKITEGVKSAIVGSKQKPAASTNEVRNSKSEHTEHNTYAPKFEIHIHGVKDIDGAEGKIKKIVRETMEEVFDDLDRDNQPIQEV